MTQTYFYLAKLPPVLGNGIDLTAVEGLLIIQLYAFVMGGLISGLLHSASICSSNSGCLKGDQPCDSTFHTEQELLPVQTHGVASSLAHVYNLWILDSAH